MEKKRMCPASGNQGCRRQVVIDNIRPEVNGGAYPVKRVVGEKVVVEADIFPDGHDQISCVLQFRRERDSEWNELPMASLGNDRWRASFAVNEVGRYRYTVTAWVDRFFSWRHHLVKRIEAGQDDPVEYRIGARYVGAAAEHAAPEDARRLQELAGMLEGGPDLEERRTIALSEDLAQLMTRYPDRRFATSYEKEFPVVVDRGQARFSAWYEVFPRSCGASSKRHGTLRDCETRLPYIAAMGFDVVYLPPIHPTGTTHRKGKNNAPVCRPADFGSPWAIGSAEGGYRAVHPKLGTLKDFQHFVAKAKEHGLEVAIDIAFQCSPDHPYIKEHPEWFRWRPDGSLQYAENPPKKYQDIYPFDFETEQWQSLWEELKDVFLFWIEQGIKIFRVDNPHTKPMPFWKWVIDEVKRQCPDVIFLSEAFTRPKVMYHLAKLGFTQSYTYFTWRNNKWELTEYFTELTQTPIREYFRPNLWPNTPDILHEYLQVGGRPAFMVRLALAATLSANYGIYGPAFELCENQPLKPGSEEYLNSEKYEIRDWNLDRPDSLKDFISRVNQARRENVALQSNDNLRFHRVDNQWLICYSKHTDDLSNIILVVVNLDTRYQQSGWVELTLDEVGLNAHDSYRLHDQLTDARYVWHSARNYVQLNPHTLPAHIFRLSRSG